MPRQRFNFFNNHVRIKKKKLRKTLNLINLKFSFLEKKIFFSFQILNQNHSHHNHNNHNNQRFHNPSPVPQIPQQTEAPLICRCNPQKKPILNPLSFFLYPHHKNAGTTSLSLPLHSFFFQFSYPNKTLSYYPYFIFFISSIILLFQGT